MKPNRENERFELYEWPHPLLEIRSKSTDFIISISEPEDAKMIRDSLNEFLKCIPEEFGGDGE